MGQTLETDQYIRIITKSGACLDIHELQMNFTEEETMKTLYDQIVAVKDSGNILRRDNLLIDGGQIGNILLDERSYLANEEQNEDPVVDEQEEEQEEPIEEQNP